MRGGLWHRVILPIAFALVVLLLPRVFGWAPGTASLGSRIALTAAWAAVSWTLIHSARQSAMRHMKALPRERQGVQHLGSRCRAERSSCSPRASLPTSNTSASLGSPSAAR